MPTYRILWPGEPPEALEADSVRVEGIHQVLRGTALVIGAPREIVLRRVPRHVLVEEVTGQVPREAQPSWAVPMSRGSHSARHSGQNDSESPH